MHYENVSQKEPISADKGATKREFTKNNTQYAIRQETTTLNLKTTNNKEKITNLISKQQKT
jgi:hypothetical protein